MKALLRNEQAQAGVGTLIIFIAMVLVAAVAAAVLIQTSGVMQSKSTATTKEAAAAIGENIAIEAVDGYRNASQSTLSFLNITIKVAAGGSSVDLSQVLVKVKATNFNYTTYNFSFNASDPNATRAPPNTFWVYALRGTTIASQVGNYSDIAKPSLEAGGLARLDVNVSSLGLTQKTQVSLALTPEKGTTLNMPLSLPAFTDVNVPIYP